MKSPRPEPAPDLTYKDLVDRFLELRPAILAGLQPHQSRFETLAKASFESSERFESDKELRQSVAEVLLACILWIEAGRPSREILLNCQPEITDLLLYTANTFLEFLILRSAVQKDVLASLGSSATAWIHLFVEFHHELAKTEGPRWWKSAHRLYSE